MVNENGLSVMKAVSLFILCILFILSMVSCEKDNERIDEDEGAQTQELVEDDDVKTEDETGDEMSKDFELEEKYSEAVSIIRNGDVSQYQSAYEAFKELNGYKESDNYLSNFKFRPTTKTVNSYAGDGKIINFVDIKLVYNRDGSISSIQGKSGTDTIINFDGELFNEAAHDENTSYVYNGEVVVEKHIGSGATYYTYDENGKVTDEVYKYDSPDYNDDTVIFYHYNYNEDGQLIEYINENNDGAVICTYSYDSNGKLTEIDYGVEKSPYGYLDVKTTFSYNEQGQCISIKYIDESAYRYSCDTDVTVTEDIFHFLRELTYDENDCIVKDELYAVNHGVKRLINVSEYGNITAFYCE